MGENKLRAAIRELWALGPNGSRLDKRKAVKKIVYAVERQERIMLHKLDWEEIEDGGVEGLDVEEGLELAEEFAADGTAEATVNPKPKRTYTRRNGTALSTAVPQEAISQEVNPKRQPARRKVSALASSEGGMVPLTPDQVSKLWGAITGGSIRITTDGSGRVVCEVSESSFKKALPVLLDRL